MALRFDYWVVGAACGVAWMTGVGMLAARDCFPSEKDGLMKPVATYRALEHALSWWSSVEMLSSTTSREIIFAKGYQPEWVREARIALGDDPDADHDEK